MYQFQDLTPLTHNYLSFFLRENEYLVLKFYPPLKRAFCMYRGFSFHACCEEASKLVNSFYLQDTYTIASNQPCVFIKQFRQGVFHPVIYRGEGVTNYSEPDEEVELLLYYKTVFKEYRYSLWQKNQIEITSKIFYSAIQNKFLEVDSRDINFNDLVDETRDRWFVDTFRRLFGAPVPDSCRGCCNFYGQTYNGNRLICAIHPNGVEDKSCPDYSA